MVYNDSYSRQKFHSKFRHLRLANTLRFAVADRGTRGVLEGIADCVTHDCGLVRIGSLAAFPSDPLRCCRSGLPNEHH